MTTKLVGLKEFRLNLASYTKEVEAGDLRLIVLKKNKPVFEINSIDIEEFTLENLRKDVAVARNQAKNEEVYTLEEAKKKLGL